MKNILKLIAYTLSLSVIMWAYLWTLELIGI